METYAFVSGFDLKDESFFILFVGKRYDPQVIEGTMQTNVGWFASEYRKGSDFWQ